MLTAVPRGASAVSPIGYGKKSNGHGPKVQGPTDRPFFDPLHKKVFTNIMTGTEVYYLFTGNNNIQDVYTTDSALI